MYMIHLAAGRIAYEEWGAGPAVLIIHGMLETGRTHARLALDLSRQYRVILPDLRGYGASRPPTRTYQPDFYQRDCADMVGLVQALGCEQVHVIGIADGAEVALLLALALPDRIASLFLTSVTGLLPAALVAPTAGGRCVIDRLGAYADNPANTTHLGWRYAEIHEYGIAEVRRIWAEWRAAVRAIIAAGGDISLARAHAIRCPVTLFNGADDVLNTPAMSRALAARLPLARLHLVPGADQMVYDSANNEFRRQVTAWLLEHATGGRAPSPARLSIREVSI